MKIFDKRLGEDYWHADIKYMCKSRQRKARKLLKRIASKFRRQVVKGLGDDT